MVRISNDFLSYNSLIHIHEAILKGRFSGNIPALRQGALPPAPPNALVVARPAVAEGSGIIDHDVGVEFFRRGVGAVLSKISRVFGDLGSPGIVGVEFGLRRHAEFE